MNVGERIRHYREASGLTQKDIADKLGVNPQTVHKYEKGIVTNIPLDSVQLMADMFGIAPEVIVGWKSKDDAKKPPTVISDDGRREIDEIFSSLSADNRAKLIELARLYLASQRSNEGKQ